ncbi:hypothetical protein CU031_1051 [Enterococcus faecium]|nr:hypothetical protein [Enterococcus faecium]MBK4754872.1 hypothetical protein [Enterococcus faecium]MBK4795171.1 hypothetical protein [Enterococcus faecium]MBK4803591.1 hypothetical protein [Enterococcus faecium]MBK4838037.1 hypothetical protein [Enterococcus faecium]
MLSICIPSFSPYFYLLMDGFYVEKAANEKPSAAFSYLGTICLVQSQ